MNLLTMNLLAMNLLAMNQKFRIAIASAIGPAVLVIGGCGSAVLATNQKLFEANSIGLLLGALC
jgi:hypothetical protein